MSNFLIKNSCKHPVRIYYLVDDVRYSMTLESREIREVPDLKSSKLEFPYLTDVALSVKKPVFMKVSLMSKLAKSKMDKLRDVILPDVFSCVKIKKVHDIK